MHSLQFFYGPCNWIYCSSLCVITANNIIIEYTGLISLTYGISFCIVILIVCCLFTLKLSMDFFSYV